MTMAQYKKKLTLMQGYRDEVQGKKSKIERLDTKFEHFYKQQSSNGLNFQHIQLEFEQEIVDGDECTICLRDIIDSEESVVLTCNTNHKFHKDCLEKWQEKSSSCPLCRAIIDIAENSFESSSSY